MKYLTLLLTLLPVIALGLTDYKTKAVDIILPDDNESGGPNGPPLTEKEKNKGYKQAMAAGDDEDEDDLEPCVEKDESDIQRSVVSSRSFRSEQSGMSGVLDCTLSEGCEWILMAPTEYVIDIDVETFEFSDCTNDTVYVGDGGPVYNVPIGTYDCDNSPTLVRSNSNNVFVRFTKSNPINNFFATWKALPAPDCCSTIYVNASSSAYISTFAPYNIFLGEYFSSDETTTSGGIDYLVHRTVASGGGNFLARRSNSNSSTPWVMGQNTSATPGDGTGFLFYGPTNVRCAEHNARKRYVDQTTFSVIEENEDIMFHCLETCPSSGPTGPSGTSSNFDGTNTFNTIVTLTCMTNEAFKFYSKCQSDGAWSSISGKCPEMASEGNNLIDEDSSCAYFTSPNWPSKYRPSSRITWTFTSQVSGSCSSPKLKVQFTEPFSIIGKLNCKRQDRLIIKQTRRKPRRLCNFFVKSAVPLMGTYNFKHSQSVTFLFRSDKRRSAEGFKATVCVKCS